VGITGLVGSGRTEFLRGLFGAEPFEHGEVRINDVPVRVGTTRQAVARGIALLPESRKDDGLVLHRSVSENMTYSNLRRYARLGWVRRKAEKTAVDKMCTRVGVKAATTEAPLWTLSGGNQQKVLFGRWLLGDTRVFLADEPTRGVDVGSKHAIYELLVDLARGGTAVLVVSSEIEEVIGLAHRVLVMREGKVVAEFGRGPTKAEVLEAAFSA
jgi:ribose transport system ATP-binding protein